MTKHRDSVDMSRLRLVYIFVGISLFQNASTVLLRRPQNSEAVVNSRVVIVCQTSEPFSVNWEHTPVGDKFPKNVFLAPTVISPYDQRMKVKVNRETGEYNLIIHSVQTIDAGKYACIDKAGLGERQVAELAVLESTPQCQESFDRRGILIDNDCGLKPEMIDFKCTLRYAGNNEPKLIWRLTGGNPIIPMSTDTDRSQGQSVVSVVIKPTLPMDGRSFTCGTSWSNINWTSSTIKLLYAYNNSAAQRISEATHLNCSANSSEQCSYEWSHRDRPMIAAVGQSLKIDGDHPGLYVCAAKCTIREHQCQITAAVVEFSAVGATDSEIRKAKIVIIVFAIITVIAISISGIAACIVMRYAAIKRGLLESSSRILSAKPPPRAIQGIAIVGNDLYIIRLGETSVNVYSLDDSFKQRREISSQDLRDPRDIAAGNSFLFITDAVCKCVWKMTTQRKTKFTKFIKDVVSPFTISINCRGEIIMAQNPDKLVTYNSNGVVVKCIHLGKVCEVYHAIQTTPDYIATSVAFGPNSENDETAGVILVSMTSETIVERFFGQNSWVIYKPCHITTNESGSIFVADTAKNRIVILDEDLRLIQAVSFNSSRFLPTRLQYKSGQLIVGQNCGTVQFLGATYLERIKIPPPSIPCEEACEDHLTEESRLLVFNG